VRSDRAHGFLIAGLINDHLRTWQEAGKWDLRQGSPKEYTSFCPECCGPCGALRDYFFTPRGRAEADAYVMALPKSHQPDRGYDWQDPNGSINWEIIEADMAKGWCPNHEEIR
jgi:hypothetical protein